MKKNSGFIFEDSGFRLMSFAKCVGDVEIEQITEQHLLKYIEMPRTSLVTWHNKYGLLLHFFEYWKVRCPLDAIPMPPKQRPAPRSAFLPHIYTPSEVHQLLIATRVSQQGAGCIISGAAFRAFLLFLYGTGALVREVRAIELRDLNLGTGTITIHGARFNRSRTIPLCADLQHVVRSYLRSRSRSERSQSSALFTNIAGESFNRTTTYETFQRVWRAASIRSSNGMNPRLQDLRHSFAVHRLGTWYKNGADMNRMIPALSAYMGKAGLRSVERYLRLTPDRFQSQLDILSPRGMRKHWRNDLALMAFLAKL